VHTSYTIRLNSRIVSPNEQFVTIRYQLLKFVRVKQFVTIRELLRERTIRLIRTQQLCDKLFVTNMRCANPLIAIFSYICR
jgi:hypothetical protein